MSAPQVHSLLSSRQEMVAFRPLINGFALEMNVFILGKLIVQRQRVPPQTQN
jgi:hypothetical protein